MYGFINNSLKLIFLFFANANHEHLVRDDDDDDEQNVFESNLFITFLGVIFHTCANKLSGVIRKFQQTTLYNTQTH